jgi:hypothetical protein
MPIPEEVSLVDQIKGLETAYLGLDAAASFDTEVKACKEHTKKRLAEIILSDELDTEIATITSKMEHAVTTQMIYEICNDIFGYPSYTSSWEESKQWLGDAIMVALQTGSASIDQ